MTVWLLLLLFVTHDDMKNISNFIVRSKHVRKRIYVRIDEWPSSLLILTNVVIFTAINRHLLFFGVTCQWRQSEYEPGHNDDAYVERLFQKKEGSIRFCRQRRQRVTVFN